jgi:hypothetical protein
LFGVSYFLEKVELSYFVDHGAVLQRGCHVRALLVGRKFTPPEGLDATANMNRL